LLLDEPTANLDQASRQRTVELICCLKQQGVAVVIASHDPLHFEQAIDKRLILENGKLRMNQMIESSQPMPHSHQDIHHRPLNIGTYA